VNDVFLETVTRYCPDCGFSAFSGVDLRPLIQFWRIGLAMTVRHMNPPLKTLVLNMAEQFVTHTDKVKKGRQCAFYGLRHLSATLHDWARAFRLYRLIIVMSVDLPSENKSMPLIKKGISICKN
jgi:hypothetical protein